MLEQIIQIINSLNIKDHIILGVSLFFAVLFLVLGIDKLYKTYLGIIIGLFLFSLINLTLFSLNDNDIGINSFREFVVNNRGSISFYSIFLIPIIALVFPFNPNISFRISKNKALNYLAAFVFGFILLFFIFSVFLSIINNKFLFSIDSSLISILKESYIVSYVLEELKDSLIFSFLVDYDYILNLIIILYIFYKMTIGGIIDFILLKIYIFLKNTLKTKPKEQPKEQEKKKD